MAPSARAMTSWVPLEANPELFGAWSAQLGLDTQQSTFHDIFGLDEELLAMVPQPVHAVLCLLPLTPNVEARHRTEDAAYTRPQGAEDVLWFQQTVRRCTLTQIGNACGTIGLLHAIANSPAQEAIQTVAARATAARGAWRDTRGPHQAAGELGRAQECTRRDRWAGADRRAGRRRARRSALCRVRAWPGREAVGAGRPPTRTGRARRARRLPGRAAAERRTVRAGLLRMLRRRSRRCARTPTRCSST